MKTANLQKVGRSADVRMQLFVNGHVHSIGQLGLGFMILDEPADHPPMDAEITLSIDGKERRWHVQLPEGISADRIRTKIAPCER